MPRQITTGEISQTRADVSRRDLGAISARSRRDLLTDASLLPVSEGDQLVVIALPLEVVVFEEAHRAERPRLIERALILMTSVRHALMIFESQLRVPKGRETGCRDGGQENNNNGGGRFAAAGAWWTAFG